MNRMAVFVILLPLMLLVGCQKQAPVKEEVPAVEFRPHPESQESGYAQEGQVSETDLKGLKALDDAHQHAKTLYERNTKDQKLKKEYVDSTVKLAIAKMESPVLDRKLKYREALALFREALKVDPTNYPAKNNKQLIEDIYRQMGRPIPK